MSYETSRECIKKILDYGTMAPSSHNSQPWRFAVRNSIISITPDTSRRLAVSDKNNRQLFISLGCATENIKIAAKSFGYSIDVSLQENSLAVALKERDERIYDDATLQSIKKRLTSRYPYVFDQSIHAVLENIQDMKDVTTEIFICTDNVKDQIARVVVDASIAAMANKDFRNELSHYVKHNLTASKIGMPAYGMGIPTAASFIVPLVIRFMNVNAINKRKDLKLLTEQTPYILIIATRDNGHRSWMWAGMKYEEIALEAEKRGLSTAPWAAPIEIGTYYQKVQKILNTSLRPQVLFRLGKATRKPPKSPRLPTDTVVQWL